MNNFGKIIILNGTSSSGKTTLSKAIQQQSANIFLHFSLDAFWNMTPSNISANSVNFPMMKLAMAKSIYALAQTGHNLVVDTIFCADKTYQELQRELSDINFSLVKVDCPLPELKNREQLRGNRPIGLAQKQLSSIHKNVVYDLTVDTFKYTSEQCAEYILANI